MNPFKVLLRGYAAVFAGKQLVSSAAQLSAGEQITIRFADGQAEAAVTAVLPERNST